MKNVNIKGKFKYLFVAIPVLLCVTIVSIILCSPKENNASDKQNDNISGLQEVNVNLASSPKTSQEEEKPVKYRLIYAKENRNYYHDVVIPRKGDDLINGYLKEVMSTFEGQDVYFRVLAIITAYQGEKYDEIVESRLKYIEEIGTKDIVNIEGPYYYLTVNAEMIKKIGEAGGCYLYLQQLPRAEGYDETLSDTIVYSLENMKEDEKLAIRFSVNCINGKESVDKLFSKNKITDAHISLKEYHEEQVWAVDRFVDYKYTKVEGELTKEQIVSLVADENTWGFNLLKEDNIAIINVTEGMKIPL